MEATPDLIQAFRGVQIIPFAVGEVVEIAVETMVGKPVSEQEADELLAWVGSDSLDWDELWEKTQAKH